MLKRFKYCIIYWGVLQFMFPVLTKSQTTKNKVSHLNLGFEHLDRNKLPVGIKWQEDGGKYRVSIDSIDQVGGKYSLQLQSIQTPGGGHMSFVDILYHLKGNYLSKKEILITAYLKLKDVKPAFAGIWYNKYPMVGRNKMLFSGNMNLRGTSDWRKYKLIFYTDSATKSISFGAYLFGKGTIHIDKFSVFIDGIPIDSILFQKDN